MLNHPADTMTVAIVANTVWNLSNFRMPLIKAFVLNGYRVVLLAPNGDGIEKLEAEGAQFIPLKSLRRKSINPITDLRLLAELRRLYRREKIDAALHYTIKPVIYGSLAARLLGVKSIATITGLGYTFLGGKLNTLLTSMFYRLALRKTEVVFFQNPDDRKLFIDWKIVSPSVCELSPGSGIDLGYYAYVSYSCASPGRFLFVGRLLSDKGIREFVEAARRARVVRPELSFQAIGGLDEGNPASVSSAELSTWKKEGVVEFLGNFPDVRPALAEASFVVLPSYREGCPRVLLEAAATGRPLIAFDVPGSREIVLDKKTGWLVPARDEIALGDTFLQAVAEPFSERQLMGERGRALMESKFSDTFVAKLYLDKLRSFSQA
ncbi:glycosyltransferase family 4 protein [Neolewinella agarilytica]|uniref:glycosyltransferase family 4 protein n=1 Tax=Neolewinella agarilytica TaxID=478744 RepID=UPI0023531D79|nr:glycosyltransferase family 4 protein [Neolewinella agarilytica]